MTGVSGSGKSTLITETLPTALRQISVVTKGSAAAQESAKDVDDPAAVRIGSVTGAEDVDYLVRMMQKPIGRTARSTLATYTGLFDRVRKLFADTDEAKRRGWGVTQFSYNMKPGRCPTCNGAGTIEVELVYLPGSYTVCPDCSGARYNDETLDVTWNGYTIAEVLEFTVDDTLDVFAEEATIRHAILSLRAVGLGYLRLGQGAPELSGGEAQRIKLATKLQRARQSSKQHTLYVLDEPTTGLHPWDVDKLVTELNRLVDAGNSVVVAEHNLSVIAQADRVVEMGPGAGAKGGEICADGTPADIAERDNIATGRVPATL